MSSKLIAIYLREIKRLHSTGIATEHSYREHLSALLKALLPDVTTINEPKRPAVDCGEPDYVLTRPNGVPLGYVEAKDLVARLDDDKHKEQFDRYRRGLGNIIFTNYLEFQLWRGDKERKKVEIAALRGDKIHPLRDNFDQFAELIKAFESYKAPPISSSHDLARRMADKARLLAHVVERALTGAAPRRASAQDLGGQLAVFREYLISDLSPKEFADVYAQTIAYGMFAARLHDQTAGDGGDFSRRKAAELIPESNPLLRMFFQHIAGYDLDNRIQWIVDDLAAIFRAVDVAELMTDFVKTNGRTDPFIHFYETFLGEYDPRLRKGRGVYYTPEPVVHFIVCAVDDILKKEFQLADGLADTAKTTVEVNTKEEGKHSKTNFKRISKKAPKVQILDPAAGTGTFLAQVVARIYKKFARQKGVWPSYVKQELLPRLNGFEVLMAPYAMAHLKLEMILQQTGCDLNGERLRIFLTNSLEEYHIDNGVLLASWLSAESMEANLIKKDAPVMVVLGNPPYSGISSNKGDWITSLIDEYKHIDGKHFGEKKHWLNDDYVKFIRYGQHFIDRNGEGILAYINNHSFLDNPTFRGMRWRLMRSFDKIYILDLHGNSKRKERSPDGSPDKNVFDIQVGVSINLFVKTGQKKPDALGKVFHFDLFGERESKYEFLWNHSMNQVKFKRLKPAAPHYFFTPRDYSLESKYQKGFSVADLMPVNTSGIITSRDSLVIDSDENTLLNRIKDFTDASQSDEDIRRRYFGTPKTPRKYPAGDTRGWKLVEARKKIANHPHRDIIKTIAYRPFDRRHIYYHPDMVDWGREKIMDHFLIGENVGLALSKQFKASPGYHHVFVTKEIFESSLVSNKTGEIGYGFPLYLYPGRKPRSKEQGIGEPPVRKPNLNLELVKEIATHLKMEFAYEGEQRRNAFSAEDLLDYIYAALHSPGYRETYRELLKTDFPRVPFPAERKQFRALVKIGAELRSLHLMESEKLNKLTTSYPQTGDNIVRQVKREKDKVHINNTQHFARLPEVAWNFHIGGFQPAQKYLKDRKNRELTFDEIRHYQKIIVALVETAKIMRKIDACLPLKAS